MLFHAAQYFKYYWSVLNVVHYVSFRALAGLLSTLFFSFVFGGTFIRFSERFFRSKSREWVPERHREKDNLPTMGGLFILSLVALNVFLWSDLTKPIVWVMLSSLIGFGAIGAWDDWIKIKYHRGVSASVKLTCQLLVALLVATSLFWAVGWSHTVTVPFLKNIQPELGLFFIPWAIFILVGVSNAVNLTDGLDGLAIGSLMPNFLVFSILCYLAGNVQWAHYLKIPYSGSAELAIIGAILMGASLGFLWYNTYPAQIFMGDAGALALGAGLAFMVLACTQELLLVISGGVFVAETVSVMVQVVSFKLFGRRVFKMAPLHHHFELLGWQEAKITARFAIISLILCLMALITIKIR